MKKRKMFPLATAFRAEMQDYTRQKFRDDLLAGLIVSLLALPLAMALAIAVGLPPRHGLFTAIVAGIVAALLGGSSTQVSGPTAAFVVILAPIVSELGLHGLVWCEIFAGILLVLLGMFRMGKLIDYVPYPVVVGFTSGIAIVIGTLALNDFLGLDIASLKGDYLEKVAVLAHHLPQMKVQEFFVGLVTLVTIFTFGRVSKKIPSPVVGIGLGTLAAFVLSARGYPVDTLLTRFSYETAEGIRYGIQPFAPVFHMPELPSFAEFKLFIKPSLVIAALAGLESLLAATAADNIAKTKHDPNAELNGIGIANILSALASGIPATGAIARTATNIHAGARTPVAAILHGVFILTYVVTLAPYISHIPMAALAALLLATAYRMSHVHQFLEILRKSPRSDVVVLVGCFLPTVLVDMVAGVTIGMILSVLFLARRKGLRRAAREEDKIVKDITK